jgi:hypothetical protein
LSDNHPAFRRRLAERFDEMAFEFEGHLDAAAEALRPAEEVDVGLLARYIIEGAIMPSRTQVESGLVHRQFRLLKEHLQQALKC